MARITFIYPDFESLGVEYLMAVCLKAGHTVDFVHYHSEDVYLGRKVKSINFSAIAKKTSKTNPDFVAFSCLTVNYRSQLNCANALKEIIPDVITVFGGVHPTAVPEIVLKEKAVDCVAIGEAEKSLLALFQECRIGQRYILSGCPIQGIVYKARGKYIGDFKEGALADLNTLPFPYKKPLYSHFNFLSREYFIMTSRGCPYNCSYCFNSYINSSRGVNIIRQRSVDNVISELLQAKQDYSPKHVVFFDDCFTMDEAWLVEFCERYKREINLPFACITVPQYLNNKKVKALNESGCYHVEIGVQSLNRKLCNEILHRRSDNIKTAKAISMLRDAGIMVQVDHIFGIPGDTLETEERSALFYNRFRPNVISTFWLTYFPKTEILNIAQQKNMLTTPDIENINAGYKIAMGSFHTGGGIKNPYYGICFLFNCLPFLPRWLVRFIIKRKLYSIFSIRNYFISVAFPRSLLAIMNRKNFIDRRHFVRSLYYFNKRIY